MLPPAKIRLTVYQGATFAWSALWRYGQPPETPVDLTGCTARMQVRARVNADEVLLSLTTENGGIVLGSDGAIALHMSATQTAALDFQSGVYDLEVVFPGGTVRRLIEGPFSVSPEVTR